MSDTLIGRKEEQAVLLEALHSGRAEMLAVFGRRRVGKTFLIKQTYRQQITFELTGLQSSNTKAQLQNFSNQLAISGRSLVPAKVPANWLEAFFMLAHFLDQNPSDSRQVIFF